MVIYYGNGNHHWGYIALIAIPIVLAILFAVVKSKRKRNAAQQNNLYYEQSTNNQPPMESYGPGLNYGPNYGPNPNYPQGYNTYVPPPQPAQQHPTEDLPEYSPPQGPPPTKARE